MLKRLALFVLAFILAVTPALADKSYTLEASAAHTATGTSSTADVTGARQVLVVVDLTAASGTPVQLDLFLQTSVDGGTTWTDMPFNLSQLDANTAAVEGAVLTNKRDIIDAKTTTTAQRNVALYENMGNLLRAKWIISGTTPSFTFSILAVAK